MSPDAVEPDTRHLRFDDRSGWFVDEFADKIRDIAASMALLDLEDAGDFESD